MYFHIGATNNDVKVNFGFGMSPSQWRCDDFMGKWLATYYGGGDHPSSPALTSPPSAMPLGPSGDFTTAPEISQLFGDIVGSWLAHEMVCFVETAPSNSITRPQITLVELGAGRGTLMLDVCRVLPSHLKKQLSLKFLECNPALTLCQQQAMAQAYPEMPSTWYTNTQALLAALSVDQNGPVFFMANEFFDALPIRQFHRIKDSLHPAWQELFIAKAPINEAYTFYPVLRDVDPTALPLLPQPTTSSEKGVDAIWSFSPLSEALWENVCAIMDKRGGSAILIDYGDDGWGQTLQVVHHHKRKRLWESTFAQGDITAHVNFQRLVSLAKTYGLHIDGPVTQRDFLLYNGIELRLKKLMGSCQNTNERATLWAGFHRLTHPHQMGTLFKVLTARKGLK